MTAPAKATERWVYLGLRQTTNDKLAGAWQQVDGRAVVGSPMLFLKPLATGATAGAVYDVAVTRQDERVSAGATTYVNRWHDVEQVATWRAAHEAATIAHRAVQQERKDNGQNELLDALRPLRLAYQRTDPRGRQALQVLLLDYLRRPV